MERVIGLPQAFTMAAMNRQLCIIIMPFNYNLIIYHTYIGQSDQSDCSAPRQ